MLPYWVNAAIKGVIEGFTEFLPISSTAHLRLVDSLLPLTGGDPDQVQKLNDMFDIVVQLPAVMAIFVLFRARLVKSVTQIPQRIEARNFWLGLFLAFIPVAIAGVLFKKAIEGPLDKPVPIAIAMIVGGLVLIVVETAVKTWKIEKAEDVSLPKAGIIGIFQCLALMPGVSRSGATIVGGRLLGLSRSAAAEFSFFLALPTMLAATLYKGYKDFHTIDWSQHWQVMVIGCVISFVVAWAVVAAFLKMIEWRHGLTIWGVYRLIVGGIILLVMQQ